MKRHFRTLDGGTFPLGLPFVRRSAVGLLFPLLLTLSLGRLVQASPGELDLTFGTNGTVLTDLFNNDSTDLANAVALQPDGKIVVAGGSNSGGSFDFALARYNANGTLDNTFGVIRIGNVVAHSGSVTTAFSSNSRDEAFAVALQPDDKIVAAGDSFSGGSDDFALARYNANGTLDATFGSGGTVTTDLGSFSDGATAIAIQKRDGRIVVAGDSDAGGSFDFALARYHVFTCNGFNVTLLGTEGADSLTGTALPDVINGLGGNDLISGGFGNDSICGDIGDDLLEGDDGHDTLNGGLGTDVCSGGSGTNTFLNCEGTTVTGPGLAGGWQQLTQSCKPEGQGDSAGCVGLLT
jgi:uncharacterized delta-60 repeat protein